MAKNQAKSPAKGARPEVRDGRSDQQKAPVWSWTDAVAQAKVPPLTKLVCLNIARSLSSAGTGWRIPVEKMMRDTGLSNRSIATHLENAREAGLLVIRREPGPNGQRGVTTYIPKFPDNVELSREPAAMPPREDGSRGPSEEGSRGPHEGGSPRAGSPHEGGSSGPREGGSRQVPFHESVPSHQEDSSHKKDSFQERGRAAAQPAPGDDVRVVEVEIIEPDAAPRRHSRVGRPPEARVKRNVRTPLSDDWLPDVAGVAFARDRGLADQQIAAAFEKFKAHHQAKGSVMADWSAAWRTWVLNEVKYEKTPPARGAGRGGRADRTANL